MKNLLCFILLVTSLAACKYSDEYTAVNANNEFSVSVPGWMEKYDDLKPGAEFQYANRYRNFYAIGTADDKAGQKPLAEVMHENLEVLRKSMTRSVVTDSSAVTIGGLNGTRVEIFGKMKDEDIYFSELVLEGNSKIYHLSIWTRGQDRKLRYKEDIEKILNSFKEL